MNSSILTKFVFALCVVFIVSCDNDYSTIGADMIEDDIHNNGIEKLIVNPVAFDKATGAVQANNLPVNALGIYNNQAFGKMTAHFVSQLELGTENPIFTTEVTIDSVYLYVPYYSTLQSTASDGASTYVLDSIYGDRDNAKMKLSVYENGYFLRSTDPATTGVSQKYFSDDRQLVEANRGGFRLNNSTKTKQNDAFFFDPAEIVIKSPAGTVKQRLKPGIYMDLDINYFMQKMVHAPAGKLLNNSVFKDYFRGIYLNVEETQVAGALAMLNFAEGKIVIEYSENGFDVNNNPIGRVGKTLNLNLKGNTISFLESAYNNDFANAINTSDEVNGDDRLYLRGGEGSMAFINIPDEQLDILRESKNGGVRTLINEANLTFYVDSLKMTGSEEPYRVYLYDVKNKRPIYDYFVDVSTNNTKPKFGKYVYGGKIQYGVIPRRGRSYKIKLTDHINNIVNKDSTNVTLGLVVTDNINLVTNAALKNAFDVDSAPNQGAGKRTSVKDLPVSSVISPSGTILYGSKPGVPEKVRLKLEIFYTKPN
jgi:hypothetical protein